jgi:2-succinyl-6-hydroxy-2,4-cyclohexadiene-1-carboxylate synthase
MTHSGTLQRGTFALAYETWGEGEALVFVHGFGTDREALRDLAQRVGEGYRVVLVDLRGHGASGAPDLGDSRDDEAAYGYPVQCEDLLALQDELRLERVHWVGHSMGGQLALMAALRAPARTHSLVAIAAGSNRAIVDEREKRAWIRAAERFETMSGAELCAALAAAAPRVKSPGGQPSEDDGDRQLYARARGAELARIVRGAFLAMRNNEDECRGLRAPALVIAGEEDAQWLEPSRRLAELLPRAELLPVQDAGHLVHLERPDIVATAIGDFLTAQREKPA